MFHENEKIPQIYSVCGSVKHYHKISNYNVVHILFLKAMV